MIRYILHKVVGRDNLYSLMSNLVFAGFGFVTFLVLVRQVPSLVFGQWVLFITISSLFDMLRLGLTGTAAIRLLSSSTDLQKRVRVVAASYQLGIVSTVGVGVLLAGSYLVFQDSFANSNYVPVFLYYPLLALANLPFNQALVVAQGNNDFARVLVLRLVAGAGSLVLQVASLLVFDDHLVGLIISTSVAYTLASLVAMAGNWDGWQQLGLQSRPERRAILDFGKYSTAGYIGSNLLRSADTILLGLFPFMGVQAIAVLAVPFKFIEVVEIPLRSFTATAFPRLSSALVAGIPQFNKLLINYMVATTVMLVPFVVMLCVFPTFFLQLMGGSSVEHTLAVQQQVLNIICINIMVLPIDRYSGVALFAMNRPAQNFYKILFMLVTNVVFDLVAIIVFQSVVFVALATLLFTILGVIMGWVLLLREQTLGVRDFVSHGSLASWKDHLSHVLSSGTSK
jgi:O-antigen/teichoic acid export membrane protein